MLFFKHNLKLQSYVDHIIESINSQWYHQYISTNSYRQAILYISKVLNQPIANMKADIKQLIGTNQQLSKNNFLSESSNSQYTTGQQTYQPTETNKSYDNQLPSSKLIYIFYE